MKNFKKYTLLLLLSFACFDSCFGMRKLWMSARQYVSNTVDAFIPSSMGVGNERDEEGMTTFDAINLATEKAEAKLLEEYSALYEKYLPKSSDESSTGPFKELEIAFDKIKKDFLQKLSAVQTKLNDTLSIHDCCAHDMYDDPSNFRSFYLEYYEYCNTPFAFDEIKKWTKEYLDQLAKLLKSINFETPGVSNDGLVEDVRKIEKDIQKLSDETATEDEIRDILFKLDNVSETDVDDDWEIVDRVPMTVNTSVPNVQACQEQASVGLKQKIKKITAKANASIQNFFIQRKINNVLGNINSIIKSTEDFAKKFGTDIFTEYSDSNAKTKDRIRTITQYYREWDSNILTDRRKLKDTSTKYHPHFKAKLEELLELKKEIDKKHLSYKKHMLALLYSISGMEFEKNESIIFHPRISSDIHTCYFLREIQDGNIGDWKIGNYLITKINLFNFGLRTNSNHLLFDTPSKSEKERFFRLTKLLNKIENEWVKKIGETKFEKADAIYLDAKKFANLVYDLEESILKQEKE